MFRVGFGYDVHRLVEGRELVLGGIMIPYKYGLLGHSDADVLIHSIIDAILGAISRGDIGQHFPDTDPRYKGIKSTEMLKEVVRWTDEKGYKINNVDATIVAERPKLAPYIDDMKSRLSEEMSINVTNISIKATTNEGLGFIGRGEAIASYAVVMIIEKEKESN